MNENSKAASDANDMLKNNSYSPNAYNSKNLHGIQVSEWGENSVEYFKSSGNPSAGRTHEYVKNVASQNPGDQLIAIKDTLMRIRENVRAQRPHTHMALSEMDYALRHGASQHLIMTSPDPNRK